MRTVAGLFIEAWGEGSCVTAEDRGRSPHEANLLTLDSRKALTRLGWRPSWTVRDAVEAAANWYRRYYEAEGSSDSAALCRADITAYCEAARRAGSAWAAPGGGE